MGILWPHTGAIYSRMSYVLMEELGTAVKHICDVDCNS